MSDKGRETTKIGAEVKRSTYKQFVNFVEEKHGKRRGVLSMELERAMRRHMNSPDDADLLQGIRADIDQIKEQVVVETDGAIAGSPRSGGRTHTQTDEDTNTDEDSNDNEQQNERPPPKSSTGKKVDYLYETFIDGRGEGTFATVDVRQHVTETYNFGDRTVKKYVKRLIERIKQEFDLYGHPRNGDVYAFGMDAWGDSD